MIFGYYKNCLYTTDISSALKKKKKKTGKESQYMVLHPEIGSDSPIGLDRESGRDNEAIEQNLNGDIYFLLFLN